jgi:hypothetical protein
LHDSRPDLVANALSSRQVRLWHKVRGGFAINDYHDVNPPAEKAKEKREKDRKRQAAHRAKLKDQPHLPDLPSHDVTHFVTRDILGKKKEETRKNSTAGCDNQLRTTVLPTCTDRGIKNAAPPLTSPGVLAFRRRASKATDTGKPKFTVIRALAREVITEHPDLDDDGDVEAIVMRRCARDANLLYDSATVKRAVEQARAQLLGRRA